MAKRTRRPAAITPTELGLLAAVADAPDDALARLVYADYLDDAGGDGPRRGEFLRAWCALLLINVRDLDGYSEAAEALEARAAGLPAEWLAAVQSERFHLADPADVAARVEAFFLRYGGSPGLIDARISSVHSTGGDWEIRYTIPSIELSPVLRSSRFLAVERATGRVHMIASRGRRAGTHRPDTLAPS